MSSKSGRGTGKRMDTSKWAKGILIYKKENEELDYDTLTEEFEADSGSYTGREEACIGKDGYKNLRRGRENINHYCGEAHVLNWAHDRLDKLNKKQPSRLILLSQESPCQACEPELRAFSLDHPNTYIQVRSGSLYESSRLSGMESDTTLFSKSQPHIAYPPLVGGAYKRKLKDKNQVRRLKINPD